MLILNNQLSCCITGIEFIEPIFVLFSDCPSNGGNFQRQIRLITCQEKQQGCPQSIQDCPQVPVRFQNLRKLLYLYFGRLWQLLVELSQPELFVFLTIYWSKSRLYTKNTSYNLPITRKKADSASIFDSTWPQSINFMTRLWLQSFGIRLENETRVGIPVRRSLQNSSH